MHVTLRSGSCMEIVFEQGKIRFYNNLLAKLGFNLNTSENIKNRIGKQHNKIPNISSA